MNWNDTLDILNDLDYNEDDLEEIVDEAVYDSKHWGCCSVSELILDYDDRWADLTEGQRCGVIENFPELSDIGREFMRAVEDEEYEKAREIHTQIQKYDLDELAIKKLITAHSK